MRRLLLATLFFIGLFFLFDQRAFAVDQVCVPYPGATTLQCPSGETCVGDASGNYTCQTSHPSIPLTTWGDECVDPNTGVAKLQGFGCIFKRVLGIIVPLLGLALFVLLLTGGFQYMTAGGDPKQTQKAAGTITTAIIGIVVVVGVWFIFQILKALTGIEFLEFTIPAP